MAQLIALYKKPADVAAFDRHYAQVHIPLAKKIPGLRSYSISSGPVDVGQGESPYHLVAVLDFDSLEQVQKGLGTPEGQATAADLGNFAQAGVELLMFDTRKV